MSRTTLALLVAVLVSVMVGASLVAVAQGDECAEQPQAPGVITVAFPGEGDVTLMTPEALLASWGLEPYPGGTQCLLSPDTVNEWGEVLASHVAYATADSLASIRDWALGFDGWGIDDEGEEDGIPYVVLFSEGHNAIVYVWGADDADVRIVLAADGKAAKARAKQARKAEDIRAINDACWVYENDTGLVAKSVADLMAPEDEGPTGYKGPYLRCAEEPTDPYTGEPYELTDGMVSGPGDVTTFLS